MRRLIIGAVFLLAGCGKSAAPSGAATPPTATITPFATTTPTPPRTAVLMAIDISKSTESMRRPLVIGVFDAATRLDRDTDALRLYAFAGGVHELSSEVPNDEDVFANTLAKETLPSSPDRGTDYSQVLVQMAKDSAAINAPVVRLVIAGDGFTDLGGSAVASRFAEAGRALAANPRIQLILLYGVKPGAREQLRRYLKGGTYEIRFIDLGEEIPPLS